MEIGGRGEIGALAFSPDGRLLAAAFIQGEVAVGEVEGGAAWVSKSGIVALRDLHFSPDGNLLSVSGGGGLRGFRAPFKGPDPEDVQESQGTTTSFSIAWCGQIRGDQDGGVWDRQGSRAEYLQASHQGTVFHVEHSPNGTWTLSSGMDGHIKLGYFKASYWNRTLRGHEKRVGSATFSPDGLLVASGDADGRVRLWPVQAGRSHLQYAGSPVRSVVAAQPDAGLVAGLEDGRVVAWREGDFNAQQRAKVQLPVRALCALPGGGILVASKDAKIRRLNIESGALEQELSTAENAYSLGCPTKEGEPWFSGHERSVLHWNGDVATPLGQHKGIVTALTLGGDGRRLYSASLDGTVKAWDLQLKQEVAPPLAAEEELIAITLGPAGEFLYGGRGARLHQWDPRTGARRDLGPQFGGAIDGLATTADRKLLAIAADDGLRLLWLHTGALRSLQGHPGAVSSVHFTPAGQPLLSGGYEGTVRAWPLPPRDRAGFQTWLSAHAPFVVKDGKLVPQPLPPVTADFTGPPPRRRPKCEEECRKDKQADNLPKLNGLYACLLTCEVE